MIEHSFLSTFNNKIENSFNDFNIFKELDKPHDFRNPMDNMLMDLHIEFSRDIKSMLYDINVVGLLQIHTMDYNLFHIEGLIEPQKYI